MFTAINMCGQCQDGGMGWIIKNNNNSNNKNKNKKHKSQLINVICFDKFIPKKHDFDAVDLILWITLINTKGNCYDLHLCFVRRMVKSINN